MMPDEVERRVVVENPSGRVLILILEPWADEYPMAPNQRWVIEGQGPAYHAALYVEAPDHDDGLIVTAWDGSDARILYEDGRVLAERDWSASTDPHLSR